MNRAPRILPYSREALAEAARLIRAGDPVAVPTETVYGLAANAGNPAAIAAIYAAKGRPDFNPLIVHVADRAMAEGLATFPALAKRLADAFWPGPLTLVLPLRPGAAVAPAVTAGLPTIALRMPQHPAMLGLIRESGCPLAAPSANASGGISPTRPAHVVASLGARVPLVLDDGPTVQGLESTILAPAADHVRLLRPGPITAEMVEAELSVPVRGLSDAADRIEAPGQLASHYAPRKPLRLNALTAARDEYLIGIGLMPCHFNLSPDADLAEAGANLFAALHQADAAGSSAIAVAPIPDEGIGAAINDRLRRAAA